MTIAFLDAVTPPVSARATAQGADQAPSGAFGAVLAGLHSAEPAVSGEQPLAGATEGSLGAATLPTIADALLPPSGKILPDLAGAMDDATTSMPETDDQTGDQTDDQTGETSTAAPIEADAALVAILAIPAVLAVPASSAAQGDTGLAAQVGTKVAATAAQIPLTANIQQQEGAAQPAQPSAETSKPAQPVRPSLTILHPPVPSIAAEAATKPTRRPGESTPASVTTLSAADLPLSTPLAAPVAVAPVAPVAVLSVNASSEAGPAPVQAPVTAIALPDHRALVEALVRARTERDPGVSVALETREFGAVALRFETLQSVTGDRSLQVALSSNDPAFERAVSSAAAAQAALADQSGRHHTSRGEQPQSSHPAGSAFGDASGGRASSDPRSQPSPEPGPSWREPSRGQAPERTPADPAALPRTPRRGGAIFA